MLQKKSFWVIKVLIYYTYIFTSWSQNHLYIYNWFYFIVLLFSLNFKQEMVCYSLASRCECFIFTIYIYKKWSYKIIIWKKSLPSLKIILFKEIFKVQIWLLCKWQRRGGGRGYKSKLFSHPSNKLEGHESFIDEFTYSILYNH